MTTTYSINEGNDALNRVLLMMQYELGKTLEEQKKFTKQDFQKIKNDEYEKGVRKYVDKTAVSFRGPDGKQISTATFPKVNLSNEELISGLEKIWVNWDHDTSGYVEIGLTGAGFLLALTGVGAPLGAVLIAAGTAVGIADAIKYYEENNPYMGTMMLALQLIPGGELVGILAKNSSKFAKHYPKFVKIIEKLSTNKVLTDLEGKIFEWGSKLFNKHLPTISKLLRKHSFKALTLKLKREKSSIVLRTIISLLHFGLKKAPSFIGKLIIKVGRISITVDQLWTLMSTPDSWREKMRDKGEFSKILDMLYDGTLTDSIKEGLWIVWQKILGNDVNEDINEELINQMESQMDKYDENFELSKIPISDKVIPNRWEKINKTNNQPIKNTSVTFNDVIKGTQTIKKGDKGDVVNKIQNMLISIGFELGNSGKNKNGVDGDFGQTTENAVKEFQKYNFLKETGIIDKLTAIQLNKDYNER
jgi:Putative peptidoglycan binding domain